MRMCTLRSKAKYPHIYWDKLTLLQERAGVLQAQMRTGGLNYVNACEYLDFLRILTQPLGNGEAQYKSG